MYIRITTIFLAGLISIVSAFGQESLPIDTLFEEDPYYILTGEADEAIKNNEWNVACQRISDAISVKPSHPSNALLYSNLGAIYVKLGNDSLALDSYSKALQIAPSMITPLIGRGKVFLSQKRDREAFEDFSKAISLDSINTDARFYHGMMALYGGVLEMAQEDFEVLKSIAPRSTDTAIALSTLYAMTGRDSEAIPYLKKLIEYSPEAEFYAALAGCYLSLERLYEASEILSQGLKKYPNDPELYYYRAWLNRDRYRMDDAQRDAKEAIKLGANPARVEELFRK